MTRIRLSSNYSRRGKSHKTMMYVGAAAILFVSAAAYLATKPRTDLSFLGDVEYHRAASLPMGDHVMEVLVVPSKDAQTARRLMRATLPPLGYVLTPSRSSTHTTNDEFMLMNGVRDIYYVAYESDSPVTEYEWDPTHSVSSEPGGALIFVGRRLTVRDRIRWWFHFL